MRKITYISTFIPRQGKDEFVRSSHGVNFYSEDAFSYALFCGFAQNCKEIVSINIPPVGVYPRNNSCLHCAEVTYEDKGVIVHSIGYSTLYLYHYYEKYTATFSSLKKLLSVNDTNYIIIYSINIPAVNAALKYKNEIDSNTRIVLIIPDFISDILQNSISSRIKSYLIGDIQKLYSRMDGFVFLTERMNDVVKTKKPYCVVEGIYNNLEQRIQRQTDNMEKRIFYSGKLSEKFGVKNLIDAFLLTDNKDYRLQLCGCGELEEYIREKSKEDDRINFLGLVSREMVMNLQSKASLLVNPRTPAGDFTKYSFPSKNIEYLASGIPTLLYELDGIPSEYYNFCYHIGGSGNDDVTELYDEMTRVLSLPSEARETMAARAKEFIETKKNAKVQAGSILNLLERM